MSSPLQIHQLNKWRNHRQILNQFDLQLQSGEVFALLGLNGAGKSTLFSCILDSVHYDSGRIAIAGCDSRQPAARQTLAYLPERFEPPSYLRVGEFLDYMAALYRLPRFPRLEVDALLQRFGLPLELLRCRVNRLSKGMTQKLGLLLIFLCRKPLLLLDEPMSGLDPLARRVVRELFAEAQQRGQTILFSTHLLVDAEALCDRVGILHRGRLLFVGSVAECCCHYACDSLDQAFLSAISVPSPRRGEG